MIKLDIIIKVYDICFLVFYMERIILFWREEGGVRVEVYLSWIYEDELS